MWYVAHLIIKPSATLQGIEIREAKKYLHPSAICKQSRLTVVSREAKKKQHACTSSGPRDHYSELFTRMAALKF